MFRLPTLFCLFGFLIVLQGCGGGDSPTSPTTPTTPTPPPPVATSVTLSATSVTVALGGTSQLSATVKDQNGATMAGKAITWGASDAAVATVSSTGLVTGVSPGTANITATHLTLSATASVVAQDAVAPEVTLITYDGFEVTFQPGVLELYGPTEVGITVKDDHEIKSIAIYLHHDGVDLLLDSAGVADDTTEGTYTFTWNTHETTSVGGIDTLGVKVWDTSGNEGIGAQEIVLMHQPEVTVTNQLMLPVVISFTDQDDSDYSGTVTVAKNSVATTRWEFLSTDSVKMSWVVIREQIGTSGYYYGESVGATFTTPRDPSVDLDYTVDNIFGGKTYYYPQFTNSTTNQAVPFIDPGIVGEINVCAGTYSFSAYRCSIAPGAADMGLGYYELKTTSTVGYKQLSGTTLGGLYSWNYAGVEARVQSGSGAASFSIVW